MNIIDSLITDRAQNDVANGTEKGYYNSSDLNRVTDAMEYLVNELQKYGYSAQGYKKGPIWSEQDTPTPQQMNEYLDNIRVIRSVLELMQTTPTAPDSMDNLTYQKANDIEKILVDVEKTIQRVIKSMSRSNAFTFWSGNIPIPCAESDKGRTWKELDAMNTTWSNWQVVNWYLLLYGNLKAEGDVV